MSYCQLLGFKKGEVDVIAEYKNAHGWTAFVWNALFEKYGVKKAKWDSWINNSDYVWKLHNDPRLDNFERFVLRSTFDYALVKKELLVVYSWALRLFLEKHQDENYICHIPQIIEDLSKVSDEYEAIGYYGMSCGDNMWIERELDEDEDDYIETAYDISTGKKHFFVDDRPVEDEE